MDGHYLNKRVEYIGFIQNWINKIIQEKSWEKHEDLHIDQIDQMLNKNEWLGASLFVYDCFLSLIDKKKYTILLAVPLSYSESPTDLNDLDLDYFKKNLDITPPSFYLFPINNYAYEMTIKSSSKLERICNEIGLKVYFKEEKEGEEYFRVVYINN